MALFDELRRRNVFRVGLAYLAGAWLLIQIAETVLPLFGRPGTARIVVLVLAVGFIPALVFAWAFELTPDGLKRDKDVHRPAPAKVPAAKKLDRVIMVMLALALGYFGFDKFVLQPARDAALVEATSRQTRNETLLETFGEKSIAVLPFADMSPGGDQAYLSDGLAEELLNLLAKIGELRVISRSSAFALRGAGLSVPEMAERLNVAYVLDGSLRKAGNRVRITAQLIEARSDTQLWSESYDRDLDDVFAIQDEISAQVVQQLKVRLVGPAPLSGATNPGAYTLYLRGISELAKQEDVQVAVELFEQVIDIDPGYVPAHASLALALVWSDDAMRHERGEAAANRALELDPGNSDALTALGRIRFEQGRIEEGREALQQAIISNPNSAMAFRWLGLSHGVADPPRYYALVRSAYRLDPLDPTIHYHLAVSLSRLGRYEEAIAAARELQPADDVIAGNIHRFAGQLDKALKSYYHGYRAKLNRFGGMRFISRILLSMNEMELAEVWSQDQSKLGLGASFASQAELAFVRGQPEEAVRLFVEATEQDITSEVWVGFAQALYGREFDAARITFERTLTRAGEDLPRFDPDIWVMFIHYALALQRSGDTDRAAELIGEIVATIEPQLAAGVVVGPFDMHLEFNLAQLHAMIGRKELAIEALERAASQGGLTCTYCVSLMPHFDSLRDDPEVEALLAAQEARNAAMRQRLADEGMLLRPEELLQLEEYSYDPFTE